jgi:protein gp37
MKMAHRIAAFGKSPNYEGLTKISKGGPVWTGILRQATRTQLNKPKRIKQPSIIFVNSMSDLFHPAAKDEWRDEAFDIMANVNRHIYQILTKRPDVAAEYFSRRPYLNPQEMPHIWLGVSVEREDAKWRIDSLRDLPTSTRFLSIEPLIGPVGTLNLESIDWVITGGESGPGARVMRPQWVRDIRDQVIKSSAAFFHKQYGNWANNPLVCEQGYTLEEAKVMDLDPKAKGGATLDGTLWRFMPDDTRALL